MRDRDFQAKILGIVDPWYVDTVEVSMNPKVVETFVDYRGATLCPTCAEASPRHDTRERRWRHLDIYEFRAFVTVRVPRVDCAEHGIHQIAVPWADGCSGFTALFERLAISLMSEMSMLAVSRVLGLTWDQLDGIMQRAVARGLAAREDRIVRHIGVDEKSYEKRHKYVTIVTDLDAGEVLWVGSGRKRETLDAFWGGLSREQLEGIVGIAMDMWPAYIESTLAAVPNAASKIVFDKFHIAKHLTHAVDLERRAASKLDPALKRTRYQWLRSRHGMSHAERLAFARIRLSNRRLARAWSIKETFGSFWAYRYAGAARRFFRRWFGWAVRSRLRHIAKAARMIARHFENIVTYLKIPITNAASESMNSKIQWMKYQARGYRNESRFMRAILFHFGRLSLMPTHPTS